MGLALAGIPTRSSGSRRIIWRGRSRTISTPTCVRSERLEQRDRQQYWQDLWDWLWLESQQEVRDRAELYGGSGAEQSQHQRAPTQRYGHHIFAHEQAVLYCER